MGIADFVDKRRNKPPPVIGTSGIPAYCLKRIGSRHLLLAGGGGAAKTGVSNEIELNTGTQATMNMDVMSVGAPEDAKYIIAAGHDEYCDLYTTSGFKLNNDDEKKLAFNMNHVGKVKSDDHPNSSYQKCVRFDKKSRGRIFATGGADGHVRIWDAMLIIKKTVDGPEPQPLHSMKAHKGDVDDLDISHDGRFVISIGNDGLAFIWSTETGEQITDVPYPVQIARGFKMRSVRCTNLGSTSKNTVFVIAYNSVSRATRDQKCYLGLWAFNPEKRFVRPVVVECAVTGEAISALSVSECGNFTAIGTMSGGVGVYDTHELKKMMFVPETHGIFVTGIEFLDTVSKDSVVVDQRGQKLDVPGPGAGFTTCIVSLSADQSVQVHPVSYPKGMPLSIFVFLLSLLSLFLYNFCWFLL